MRRWLALLLALFPLEAAAQSFWWLQAGGSGTGGATGGMVGVNEFARKQGGTYTVASPGPDGELVPNTTLIADGPDAQGCWTVASAATTGLKFTNGINCAPTTVLFRWEVSGQHAEAGNAQFDFSVFLDEECDGAGAAVVTGSRVSDYVVPTGVDFHVSGSAVVTMAGTASSCIYLRANEDLKGSALTLTGTRVAIGAVELVNPSFSECNIAGNEAWTTRYALTTQCVIPQSRVLDLMRGGLIHNRGQAAGREIELPAAALGDNFTVLVVSAQSICIDPNLVEEILGLTTAAGNKVCSSTIGSSLSCAVVKDSGGGGFDWMCTGSGFADGGA